MSWREAPVISAGPSDFTRTLYAALGVKGADAEWAMEQQLSKLTFDQLREVALAVSRTPLGSSPHLSFSRAMAAIPPPLPVTAEPTPSA